MSINKSLRGLLMVGLLGVVVPGCAASARGGGIGIGFTFVDREPPARRVEVVSVSPGPEYVWTAGYWSWRGGNYEWTAGSWRRPEGGRHEWIEGHWERERRGWYFVEGHWR